MIRSKKKSGRTETLSLETIGSRAESLRLFRLLSLNGAGDMVNYILLVGALTFVWAVYAGVRLGPWMAKRWRTWGEVAALLAFMAVELGLLVAFLRPS